MKNVAMKESRQHVFAEVPSATLQRSVFDRSFNRKMTFDSGFLVPCYLDELLPGDTFECSLSHVTRMTTAVVPSMDNIYQDFFAFVVPVRLLWTHAEQFFGAWKSPTDTTQYLAPVDVAPSGGWANGSLQDYFGWRPGITGEEGLAFYPRGYYKIYNDWFRKGAVEAELSFDTGDGPDSTNYTLQRRYKRADYFTSALPYLQKGNPVQLPLTGNAIVKSFAQSNIPSGALQPFRVFSASGVGYGSVSNSASDTYPFSLLAVNKDSASDQVRLGVPFQYTDGSVGVPVQLPGSKQDGGSAGAGNGAFLAQYADMSSVASQTISEMRTAFAMQRWQEALARATGGRYIEIIKGFFNVDCPDYRLQRAEFIGKVTTRINLNSVVQTSGTDSTSPQGNLSAFGYGSNYAPLFKYSANEHCILMVLTNIRTDNTYQYGLNRMFSRRTRFDYYWPQFSHLSEQEILNKEIFVTGNSTNDNGVWAYQERYAEYRYHPSEVCGQFRSDYALSLDVWHFAQKFNSLPVYGQTFLKENPAIRRNMAIQYHSDGTTPYPEFWMDIDFKVKAFRPMPTYSVPGLIDHF